MDPSEHRHNINPDLTLDRPVTRQEFAIEVISELNRLPNTLSDIEIPFMSGPRMPYYSRQILVPTRTVGTNPDTPVDELRVKGVYLTPQAPHTSGVTHPGNPRKVTPTGHWPVKDRVGLDPCPSAVTTSTSTAEIDIDTPKMSVPVEITLRVKCPLKPNIILRHVMIEQPVGDFVKNLSKVTEIPVNRLKILTGFPPKRIAFDRELTVESLGFRSQESIIVEKGSPTEDACTGTGNCYVYACKTSCRHHKGCGRTRPATRKEPFYKERASNTPRPEPDGQGPIWNVTTQVSDNTIDKETLPFEEPILDPPPVIPYPTSWDSRLSQSDEDLNLSVGILLRQTVPADNSCLFASFRYALLGILGDDKGFLAPDTTMDLRLLVAEHIDGDRERYTEAFLGRPNNEYGKWITRLDSWGGGIELSILSEHHRVEIAVVNTQTATINVFGEGQNYIKRIYLIYDGVHYDPLFMERFHTGKVVTRFHPTDTDAYNQALDMAKEARGSHQFVDLKNFVLKCDICKAKFTGNDEATMHARLTGHFKFSEVKPS